ncbi:Uncharacterised protein [BD1-7 clade bacterium]|uniref:Glycosyltransferase n=1 Tax=BD1-7 clade bacterium TaxID=2029982 RepID=A0A5S9NVU9_9GAMM|nr:Uncharacterised protein [BD1-7 clade bacterium]CAA0094849.1 Uncharacterised protein [BD1-7 clade bacterium]
MKILYGVQGTGNGHLARARALTPALRSAGVDIDFVFSGRERDQFFNMELFGDDFRCFNGMTFATKNGRLQPAKTVVTSNIARLLSDVARLDLKPYDAVISDFEPVTAWAAKLKGVPSLGISHQSAFDYDVPKVTGHQSSKILMRFFAPTKHKVGLHWHHFDQQVLPPLIEPQTHKPPIKGKIVVYMGFEAIEEVIKFVTPFDHCEFHIYAKVDEKRDLGHIKINPLSHQEFHDDLLDADGVISNAGFELASECIHLGKKVLIKPLLGQYEQLCNALAIQALGRGTVIEKLDQQVLEKWLESPGHQPANYPDVADAIAKWVINRQWESIDTLVKALWHETSVKQDYDASFGNQVQPGLIY